MRDSVDAGMALGFGLQLAWFGEVARCTFPLATEVNISPLGIMVAMSSIGLLLAFWLLQRGTFQATGSLIRATGVSCVIIATICGLMLQIGFPVMLSYILCGVIGACALLAQGSIVWGISTLGTDQRIATMVCGMVIAGIVEALACLVKTSESVSLAVLAVEGALAIVGVLACVGMSSRVEPMIYRPSSSQHFHTLMIAIVLYAAVFGAVIGVDSSHSATNMIRRFDMATALATIALGAVILALAGVRHQLPSLRLIGCVLTPIMAALFLLFFVLPDGGRAWLPSLTVAFWQAMQTYALLILIDISKSGVGSMPLVYCLGAAAVCGGFAAGALVGQGIACTFGPDVQVASTMSIAYTMIAVIASSLMMWAKFPEPASELIAGAIDDGTSVESVATITANTQNNTQKQPQEQYGEHDNQGDSHMPAQTQVGSVPDDSHELGSDTVQTDVDPIAAACACIVQRYALSEREAEVCELLTRGNTRAGIATRLYVSENTVRTHVKNIYAKLDIHSKQQLIDLVDNIIKES